VKPLLPNHENKIKKLRITLILMVEIRSKIDSLEDKYSEVLKI